MLALYRFWLFAGAHALAVFERTRRTLQRELGVRPGPELEQLHRRIMANDLALRLPPRPHTAGAPWCSNLPGSVAHFTGRRTELRQLRDILRAHDAGNPAAPVIIAIDGLPGVGKTALAVRLCHEVTPAYPGAQLFIDLHGYALRHPVLDPFPALATLLGAMGVPAERVPPTLEARSAMWRGQLADRRALVILDNVASTAQIGPQPPATPGCLAVVTSRHRLTGLHYTFQLSVHELSRAEGRSLFGRVVGDQRPLAEPDAVDTVAQQCGRLPLAIRVAATKLRHRPAWAVAYLASRLADDRRRLAELGTEDGGVADAFALSYERLAPIHQRLFRLIGMMRGPVISSQDVAGLAEPPHRAHRAPARRTCRHPPAARGHARPNSPAERAGPGLFGPARNPPDGRCGRRGPRGRRWPAQSTGEPSTLRAGLGAGGQTRLGRGEDGADQDPDVTSPGVSHLAAVSPPGRIRRTTMEGKLNVRDRCNPAHPTSAADTRPAGLVRTTPVEPAAGVLDAD